MAALGAVVAGGSATARAPSEAARPNVVLVMADDQGWGDMAYNGHAILKTPHFDAAAAAGLRFDRFYAAAPVCSPTRASVMTGRHPNRMGVFKWGYPLRPQEQTLAETLRDAGYATAHFGKWHLGSVRRDSPAHPGRHGFEHWLSAPNFFDNDPILSREGEAVPLQGESSAVVVDAAIEWIAAASRKDRPFLAVVWFGSPHSPHRAAEEDRRLYADQPVARQHFYGEVSGMDRAFGRLRTALGALGVRDNTILWYCSDNGGLPKVGATGGRGNKGQVYDGGLLVPAILEWPARLSAPRVTKARCSTCDIYPTILEWAGVAADAQRPLDGESLASLLDRPAGGRAGGEAGGSGAPARRRPLGFWDYPARGISTPSAQWMAQLLEAQKNGGDLPPHATSQRAAELPDPPLPAGPFPGHSAWISGDWKLHRIAAADNRVRWELYDLAADPMESRNLAEQQVDRVKELGEELERWLAEVVDSFNGKDY